MFNITVHNITAYSDKLMNCLEVVECISEYFFLICLLVFNEFHVNMCHVNRKHCAFSKPCVIVCVN